MNRKLFDCEKLKEYICEHNTVKDENCKESRSELDTIFPFIEKLYANENLVNHKPPTINEIKDYPRITEN